MNRTNFNDSSNTSSVNIEEYITSFYNPEIADVQNMDINSNFSIQDFGDILFAENDRRSKYVRIPFPPPNDNTDETIVSSLRRRDATEGLGNITLSNTAFFTDRTANYSRQKLIPTCVVGLMRYGWKLPSPQLIISVTGGAHLFKLTTPRTWDAFQRELIAAAVTTDAWIITGGTYAGIMKEVGDAVDRRRYKGTKSPSKVQCIGIASWYYATDHQHLIQQRSLPFEASSDPLHPPFPVAPRVLTPSIVRRSDNETSIPIPSYISHTSGSVSPVPSHGNINLDRTRIYRRQNSLSDKDSCPLDPNHTHFILLDDMLGENMTNELTQGVNCRADFTIKLRAEIERAISCSYSIPIVQILANGGPSSILTICQALQQRTSVIVIEGTGRAADEVASEYRWLYGNHQEQRSDQVYEQASSKFDAFAERFRSTLERKSSFNHTNRKEFIKQITSREGYFLISIFQFYNEQGAQKLDDAILHSVLNATRITNNKDDQRINELQLAMAWNKFDRIQRNILNDRTIVQWTELELDRALRNSLRMNKVRLVNRLVEYGASFDRLQRFNVLKELYGEVETSVLPYSEWMLEKIHSTVEHGDWNKPNRKYLYEDYLAIDIDDKQILSLSLLNESMINYGVIDDDDAMSTQSKSHFDYPVCVFNAIDTIQVNGFVKTISIRFDGTRPISANDLHLCYLITPTNEPNFFNIDCKRSLQLLSNNSSNLFHYNIPEKHLFVTNGQYIAIGFTHRTGFPCTVTNRNQYSLPLDQVTQLSPFPSKSPLEFHVESAHGVAISFNIIPSPAFSRELFFWSLYFNRSNMATYLCSKSSNTILAALFASKIYHQAASFTNATEKRLEFIKKKKAFARHASIIVDMCFEENEQFALDILTKPSSLFFNKNPLQVAKETHNREFLATKTVQRYLDQQWYGNGYDNFGISYKMFILCILPFFIPLSKLSDNRRPKTWEEKPHVMGWRARIFHRFKNFYHERAIVRFYYNIIFYILFLTLFSFVLLVDYFPLNVNGGQRNGYKSIFIPVTEIVVHILVWSLIFEEGREFIQHWNDKKTTHNRYILWNYYMQDKWNILDMFAIVFYLLGFMTRWIVHEYAFITSKILMCIDLLLWYIRILHVFAAYERLGPKLLMIFNTMKDLMFFFCFIIIFLAGYSVASYALILTKFQVIWRDSQNQSSTREFRLLNNGANLWSWQILRDLIDWGIWKVYAQIDLNTSHHLDGETEITLDNDAYGVTAFILTIFFVCVANVLLLNVLVALFNVTIQKVDNSAHESWAYHRFILVSEYSRKTFLPPPLNLLIYIIHPLYRCLNRRAKTPNNIYGIHAGDKISGIDSNLFDMVVFNAVDRIRHPRGYLTSITINFSSPTLIDNPLITVYLLSREVNHSNMFRVDDEQIQTLTNMKLGRKGVQTIVLERSMQCSQGQFVALAFVAHCGSPASVKDRNEYSINLNCFRSAKEHTRPILFNNYPNKGAAFSFLIEPSGKAQRNQIDVSSEGGHQLTEVRQSTGSLPWNPQNSNTQLELSSSTTTDRNKFEERDNMLRESSIAEDYWKRIIDEIKQQEAKMVEEQTDKTN